MPSMAQNAARQMRREYRKGKLLVMEPVGVIWSRPNAVVYHKGLCYKNCGVYVFEDKTVVVYRDSTREAHVARNHSARHWIQEIKRSW